MLIGYAFHCIELGHLAPPVNDRASSVPLIHVLLEVSDNQSPYNCYQFFVKSMLPVHGQDASESDQ